MGSNKFPDILLSFRVPNMCLDIHLVPQKPKTNVSVFSETPCMLVVCGDTQQALLVGTRAHSHPLKHFDKIYFLK